MPPHVQTWERCDAAVLRDVRGVLTDIDDTLTTEGAIPMGVAAALGALREAGLPVIAVTGRPMGWSLPIAQHTPLAAVVAENGAVAIFAEAGTLRVEYAQGEAERARNALRLRAAADRILAEVPEATLARDSAGRVTDIAVDHSEFAHLEPARIEEVVAIMRSEGMNATVSSIHVNGWFGAHSKLTGAAWICRRLLERELEAERAHWVYVGDSTNDQLMFAHFPLSVGVANLMDFADRLAQWPAYLTSLDRGRGFVEVAERLLDARAR
ncbi:MAG TPA: HAD-IIB family hydrolase [Caldimonas sp.]|nr:HAD-IIB family hydrolase [Caldimonas sp.]HEX2540376.1 HAD-IIB family hydrolase [Caldimonas sp.]